ncbi:MAG: LysR substrate-binding domain-containing protein [Pseudomonas sp.]
MDFESLRIFGTVAVELSITRAATKLGRVQSNVTSRIQKLEADMGVELFVRSGKRMTLSCAGERFLDYSKRILALEEEARHVVTGGAHGGALRIGSMESTAASRLPTLLSTYHTHHPANRLEVSTGPSRTLLEQVRNGQLDCAFAALPATSDEPAMLLELGLSAKAIWQEELLLLLPTSEAGAQTPAQVRSRSLAAFKAGCTYRAIAEETLGIVGNTEWKIQEMGSYHAMLACVAAGACVTILPRSVLELAKIPAGLQTLPLQHVDTCLVWRSGYDVPAFHNLLNLIASQ